MVLGVGVATLAAWFVWFGIGRVSVYETSQQARLEADAAPREISSLQSGRLVASQLQIGRAVRAGEILAELDASAETLRLREEQERVRLNPGKIEALRNQMSALRLAAGNDRRSAEAAIEAAEARLREATAAAEFANDNARRMRTESENGGIAEIDALRAASDASKLLAQRDALSAETRKLGLDAESRTRESEARIEELNRTLATLESDTEAARALVSRLKLEIENYRVRAPVDGIVGETQALAPGAFVAQGQKLATVVPSGGFLIVGAFNPATSLGRVRPGQHARLRLDGFPWAQYGTVDARVLRVAGEIRDNTLKVELAPESYDESGLVLRHGLTGSVEIEIESASPAMLLLRSAGQAVGLTPASASAPLRTAEASR